VKPRLITLFVACLLAVGTQTFGQVSINRPLRGRVTNPDDSAITGATLTLTNLATTIVQTTTSDSAGNYQFARVAPGAYRLTITKEGFKSVELSALVNERRVKELSFSERNFILCPG
jgi:hypothetical protein